MGDVEMFQELADACEKPPEVEAFEAELAHPDPDPERVTALAPIGWAPSDPIIAGRLVRAALKQKGVVAKLKEAAAADAQAWGHMIAAHQAREDALRRFVESYLLSTAKAVVVKGVEKIKYETINTPFGRAHMTNHAPTLEYDEEKVLAQCKAIAADEEAAPALRLLAKECIRTKESVKAKELRVLFDSAKDSVKDLVKEIPGEPSVTLTPA